MPLRHPTRSSVTAFTLVELMTVIVIIGVLVAITIPVISNMRTRAQTAGAMSNIRQLVIAHHAYAADNKNWFPPVYDSKAEPPQTQSWQTFLGPYVGDKNGSSGDDRYRLREDPGTIFNVPDSKPRDERATNAVSIARSFYSDSSRFRPHLVPNPNRYILLGECEERNMDRLNTLSKTGEDSWGTVKGSQAPIGFRRENGTKALMGFCDASVRALGRDELRDDISAQNGNPWRWW